MKRGGPIARRTPLRRLQNAPGRTKGKKKGKSLTSYKKALWKVFSLYIRQRDDFTCVTCGRTAYGGSMHAGHFIPRSIGGLALYFDERNVAAQCYHCNINLSGNWPAYRDYILLKYGAEVEFELQRKRGLTTKFTPEMYKALIEYYSSRVSS